MKRSLPITLDEALRPMKMTCGQCGSKEFTAYPCPRPEGTGYCPNCSPKWLKSFAIYSMNEYRKEKGLTPVQ